MTDRADSTADRRRRPLAQLVLARIREFRREPAALFWVYIFPLVMTLALGIAFRNRPVAEISVVVQEGRRTESVLAALNGDQRFRAAGCGEAECRFRLRTGRADLHIVADVGTGGAYQYYFDPTRAASVLARNAANDVLQRAAGREDVVQTRSHEVNEPGGRYIDFLVPGLLALGLMGGGMWGVGFAIVDMRIRKLLKRYLATPMKRGHFLAGIMISRLIFTAPEVILLLVFARLFFGVTSQGSYLDVTLLILLGAFQFSGIGLLVASRAQTIETVSGIMNAVMLPMWIASGIFFSTERFPAAVQPLIKLLPLTPLIQALRGVMLEGASLFSLGFEIVAVVAWGVVCFALALRWFRWS
jgi:ABC-type multidrug transport system permease subunit